MNIKKKFLIIIVVIILINGCAESPSTVKIKKLSTFNTTTYKFNLPKKLLRDTLMHLFTFKPQYNNETLKKVFISALVKDTTNKMQILFNTETADTAVFSKNYFEAVDNKDDIYLNPMGDYWYSSMYFNDEKPFEFSSAFALKLKEISGDSTMLTIITIKPHIVNGTKCCGPHGVYSITQPVQATTVEEYTLLLFIAGKLGEKGLRPLKVPQ